jgi:hypothetical protein
MYIAEPMKRVSTFLFLALALASCTTSKPKAPPRPALVPDTAVWAGGVDGGNFFECDVDGQDNVNRCLVYNDYTGDVDGGGFFRLSGLNRPARADELQYLFFDGDLIHIASGTLVPVEPIRPNAVPNSSAFANGLFIYCGETISNKTECSIYRPNGSQYFKGSFSVDPTPTTEIKHEYKFFGLSERTIYLESGGALVAR